MAVSLKYYFKR